MTAPRSHWSNPATWHRSGINEKANQLKIRLCILATSYWSDLYLLININVKVCISVWSLISVNTSFYTVIAGRHLKMIHSNLLIMILSESKKVKLLFEQSRCLMAAKAAVLLSEPAVEWLIFWPLEATWHMILKSSHCSGKYVDSHSVLCSN